MDQDEIKGHLKVRYKRLTEDIKEIQRVIRDTTGVCQRSPQRM